MSAEGVFKLVYSEECRRFRDVAERDAARYQNEEIKATIMNNMERQCDYLYYVWGPRARALDRKG